MNRSVASFVLAACGPLAAAQPASPADSAAPDRPPAVAHLPAAFVTNTGQWPARVRFGCRIGDGAVFVEDAALVLDRPAAGAGAARRIATRLVFLGDGRPRARGVRPLPGRTFHLRGDRRPATGHRFAEVRLENVGRGIDVRLRTEAGALAYDLLLAGKTPSASLRIRVAGADCLETTARRTLRIRTGADVLTQSAPRAWQVRPDGSHVAVPSGIELLPGGRAFRLTMTPRDPRWPTVVDPTLRWATYLGGSAYEFGYACAVLPGGDVVVCGETASPDFPTTLGAYDTTYNGFGAPSPDVFVARLDATGSTLRYATYVGGSTGDRPFDMAIDDQGRPVVVGNATSGDFPTTSGAPQTRLRGRSDGFAFRLAADGSALDWSTFVGGRDGDIACSVALTAGGDALVGGVTSSSDFPVTAGAWSTPAAGNGDAFATRIDAAGTALAWSTRFGGDGGDNVHATALAPDGSLVLAGVTSSSDFPTTPGALQTQLSGNSDSFALTLSADGATLRAATLLGGGSGDVAEAVAVTADGDPVLCGVTSSSDFPTGPGALQSVARGNSDAFATRLTADATTLVWSTRLGGSRGDAGKGVLVDRQGAVVIGGQTSSSDFPTTPDAPQRSGRGNADGFVARLAPDGTGQQFATLVGGGGSDGGEGLDGDGAACVALIGVTASGDLPATAGTVGATLAGTNDGFVAVLDVENGLRGYGEPSPACAVPPAASGTRRPAAGSADFALISTAAPAGAAGFVLVGTAADPAGTPIAGIDLHIGLSAPPVVVGVTADAHGSGALPLPLVGVPPGVRVFSQFLWLDPTPCGPAALRASRGLEVTVQ